MCVGVGGEGGIIVCFELPAIISGDTLCSYECCQHELKAKKRKGELEETVADKQSQRAELTGKRERHTHTHTALHL